MDVNAPVPTLENQLTRYRARIRRTRRLRYGTAVALLVGVLWAGTALVDYFEWLPSSWGGVAALATVGLIIGAIGIETLLAPSPAAVNTLLDRRLDDRQRVTTAAEVAGAPTRTPLAETQIATTATLLAAADPRVLYPARPAWPLLWLAACLLFAALGLGLLKDVRQAFVPLRAGTLPKSQLIAPTPVTEAATDAAARALASDNAQAALDRLARALNEQSVTQRAAASMRAHDYKTAAQQISDVGAQNDQLSFAARHGLNQSLTAAALDSAQAAALQDAEQTAADALDNGDFATILSTMRALAAAVLQTASHVVAQQDLAKAFPSPTQIGTPAAVAGGPSGAGTATALPGAPADGGASALTVQPTIPNNDGKMSDDEKAGREAAANASSTPASTPSIPAAVLVGTPSAGGTPNTGEGGQQDTSGAKPTGTSTAAGNGSNNGGAGGNGSTRVTGGPVPQLTVAGDPFALDAQPTAGTTRNGTSTGPPALSMEGNGAPGDNAPVTRSATGPAPAESNNPPIERWDVIRHYFSPDQDPAP